MYRRLAIGLLLTVLAISVYRAWTQSITCDEAFSHSLYLTASWSQLFNYYDACHHVLHTMLLKASVQFFGLSEFTLRLPSLLGGLLYLVVAYRLARHVFGEGRQFLLAVALLSLNPLVLDFLSAARGYGLALALFLSALYQVLLYAGGDRDVSRIYKAGVSLGLSVAANLTLLAPGTGLAMVFLLILARERRFSEAVDSFIVSGLVTAFVIVALPLTKAHRDDFYVGEPSLGQTLRNLSGFSIDHHPLSERLSALSLRPDFWPAFFANVLAPAVLACTSAACLWILYRWIRQTGLASFNSASRLLLIGGGSLLLGIGVLVALHARLQVLYPTGRTGLYLIPLLTLAALALPESLAQRRIAFLGAGIPVWIIGLALVWQYLLQLQTTHYGEWRYDAATKKIANLIRERHPRRSAPQVRVGVTWMLEPSLNFYRRLYGLGWLEPFTRKGPDGEYDYYVLLEEDATLVHKRGLQVLYSDRFAGVTLAAPVARLTQ